MPTPPSALVPPLSPATIRSLRFASAFPHLAPTTPLPTALDQITHILLAVQAQEPNAILLSYWLRLPPPRPARAQLSALLLQGSRDSSFRRLWANRVTLQCVRTADARPLCVAVMEQVEKTRLSAIRRCAIGDAAVRVFELASALLKKRLLREEQLDSSFVDELVHAELEKERAATETRAERGYFTAAEIADAKRCIRYSLFVWATVHGYAERVLRDGGGNRIIVSAVKEMGRPFGVDEAALYCCRRYFEGYGPCTEADFRYWMGITAAVSKKAVGALMEEGSVEEVMTEMGPMLIAKDMTKRTVAEEEGIRLVGRFEPVLLAHKDRSWIIGEKERKRVWNSTSDTVACVLKRGKIRGTWKKNGNDLRVLLFADGEEAFGERDIAEVIQKGAEILSGFYEKKGEIVIEKESEDGKVEVLSAGERRNSNDNVDLDEDGEQKTRLRKRRRRARP